jgi:hypothetical protein
MTADEYIARRLKRLASGHRSSTTALGPFGALASAPPGIQKNPATDGSPGPFRRWAGPPHPFFVHAPARV